MELALSLSLTRARGAGGATASEELLTLASAIDANVSVWNFDDAATLTTREDGADTYVSGLADGLGNRAELVQTTAAEQPDLIEISGRKVGARVGGSLRLLEGTYNSVISLPLTRVLVVRSGDTAQQRFCNGAKTNAAVLGINTATDWFFYNGSDVTGGTADTDWHFIQGNFNGASSELYVDGVLVVSGDAGASDVDSLALFSLAATSNVPMSAGGRIGVAMEFPALVSNDDTSDLRTKVSEFYPIGQSL